MRVKPRLIHSVIHSLWGELMHPLYYQRLRKQGKLLKHHTRLICVCLKVCFLVKYEAVAMFHNLSAF